MGAHKLTAGDGYLYLIRQVAAGDCTDHGYASLGDYYLAKGESPGTWMGKGLEALGISGEVTENQMKNLFGKGIHPNADQLAAEILAAGGTVAEADQAGRLGAKFPDFTDTNPWRDRLYKQYQKFLADNGRLIDEHLTDDEKATVRTELGTRMFAEQHGRPPLDDGELAGFIARQSRPARTAVAGFDLTFTPVKTISTLWAIAPLRISKLIEAAHTAAVTKALEWLEGQIAYTRIGRRGVGQVPATGLITAAFMHRDSRAGDPNLHTHVAVANKVRTHDGKWLALDARMLYHFNVAGSEFYNSQLETEITTRLGGTFHPRPGDPTTTKRPVREYSGVDLRLAQHWSARRHQIDLKLEDLAAQFVVDHHRTPSTTEMIHLAQQATLATRQAKHEPRSMAEQRQAWRAEARTILGRHGITAMLHRTGINTTETNAYDDTDSADETVAGAVTPTAPAATASNSSAVTTDQTRDVSSTHTVTHPLNSTNRRTTLVTPKEVPVTHPATSPAPVLAGISRQVLRQLAEQTVHAVAAKRARWRISNLYPEAMRQCRTDKHVPTHALNQVAIAVTHLAAGPEHSVPIGTTPESGIDVPAGMRAENDRPLLNVASSQLFTSPQVLDAEQHLITLAGRTDGTIITTEDLALAALEFAATRPGAELNTGQLNMIRQVATTGRRIQLVIAPAGTGKTTALGVLAAAWRHGTTTPVIGLAPQATAAQELAAALGGTADTLDKLVWEISHTPPARWPQWIRAIRPGSLVIIDEAGLSATTTLDAAVSHAIRQGASVLLIGDDRQRAAIGAGGILRDLENAYGSITLTEVLRFSNRTEGQASLAVRDGDPAAIGFYLDNNRVHTTTGPTAADQVYNAWAKDIARGWDSIMIAPTLDLVTELNSRARTDRLTRDPTPEHEPVTLAGGEHAGIGDIILTKTNNRRLPLGGSDYVKNGDRWTITAHLAGGGVLAKHLHRPVTAHLPAGYLAEHVRLGYADVLASVQGITVGNPSRHIPGSAHTIITDNLSRNDLYPGITRAVTENHLYPILPVGDDIHDMIRPETLTPPTTTELLTAIITRDGASTSATTTARQSADPTRLLGPAADGYHLALHQAAVTTVGEKTMNQLQTEAETAIPGITQAPAWPTLHAHLALTELAGNNSIQQLRDAADGRELSTANDIAAILYYRLDGDNHQRPGPLPWLPAIPTTLQALPDWHTYLTHHAKRIEKLAQQVRATGAELTPASAPQWAVPYLQHPTLLSDLAVWRAAESIPDPELRPAGEKPLSNAQRTQHRQLHHRCLNVVGHANDGADRWATHLGDTTAELTADSYWPVVAARLNLAETTGIPIHKLLHRTINTGPPLPVEQPAAALWWRLVSHLGPDLARIAVGANAVRPRWAQTMETSTAQEVWERVEKDRLWPTIVARMDTAIRDGHPADHTINNATKSLTAHLNELRPEEWATTLLWHIATLTDPEPIDPDEIVLPPDPADLDLETPLDISDVLEQFTDKPDIQTQLATLANDLPEPASLPGIDWQRGLDALDQAKSFFESLRDKSWVPSYIRSRGLPAEEFGYAPPGSATLLRHLNSLGFDDNTLLATGLIRQHPETGRLTDFFRNRAVLPITNPDGQTVAFIGRKPETDTNDRHPKYMNSPTTRYFQKSNTPYGLTQDAMQNLQAGADLVITEGPMDALAVNHAIASSRHRGFVVAIASNGTAVTAAQLETLNCIAPLSGRKVVLALDSDDAGQTAAARTYHLLTNAGIQDPRAVKSGSGKDPAEVLQRSGPEQLILDLVAHQPLADLVVDNIIASWPTHDGTIESRHNAYLGATEFAATMPEDMKIFEAVRIWRALDKDPINTLDRLSLFVTRGTDALESPTAIRKQSNCFPQPARALDVFVAQQGLLDVQELQYDAPDTIQPNLEYEP